MYEFLLRNKWVLLAAFVLTLAALQVVVSRGSDGGLAVSETPGHRVEDPQHEIVTPVEPDATVATNDNDQQLADDNDLIDPADGDNPAADDDGDQPSDDGADQAFTSPQDPSPADIEAHRDAGGSDSADGGDE